MPSGLNSIASPRVPGQLRRPRPGTRYLTSRRVQSRAREFRHDQSDTLGAKASLVGQQVRIGYRRSWPRMHHPAACRQVSQSRHDRGTHSAPAAASRATVRPARHPVQSCCAAVRPDTFLGDLASQQTTRPCCRIVVMVSGRIGTWGQGSAHGSLAGSRAASACSAVAAVESLSRAADKWHCGFRSQHQRASVAPQPVPAALFANHRTCARTAAYLPRPITTQLPYCLRKTSASERGSRTGSSKASCRETPGCRKAPEIRFGPRAACDSASACRRKNRPCPRRVILWSTDADTAPTRARPSGRPQLLLQVRRAQIVHVTDGHGRAGGAASPALCVYRIHPAQAIDLMRPWQIRDVAEMGRIQSPAMRRRILQYRVYGVSMQLVESFRAATRSLFRCARRRTSKTGRRVSAHAQHGTPG